MSSAFSRTQPLEQGIGDDPILYATRLFVRFLQGLFNFMEDGQYHWEPDDEISQIIITGETPLNMSAAGKRPAITVMMGPYQFQGLSIDQVASMNMSSTRRTSTDLINGYMVVYCIATMDTIASRLAWSVTQGVRQHRRLLESVGGFFSIARQPPSVNSPSPPGSLVPDVQSGLVMVQVNIPFQLQWSWKSQPGRQSPHDQSLAMILAQERAVDYPYASPRKLLQVRLAMSTAPVFVRTLSGSRQLVEQSTESKGLAEYNLRPATASESEND